MKYLFLLLFGCACCFAQGVPPQGPPSNDHMGTPGADKNGIDPQWVISAKPTDFVLVAENGDEIVRISLQTGKVTYGPHYKPDEAARKFWEAVAAMGMVKNQPCPEPLKK